MALEIAAKRSRGCILVGLDEAGRGPLAGPVIAAAVALDPDRPIEGLDDSKRLSASRREELCRVIKQQAAHYAIGRAEASEIDAINILQASLLAMRRAVNSLAISPDKALVDGRICPALGCHCEPIVRGDGRIAEIAAASILAKVARDAEMRCLHEIYPLYRFDRHKGYPTREHLDRLQARGVSPIHRRSFAPIRDLVPSRVFTGADGDTGSATRVEGPSATLDSGRWPSVNPEPTQLTLHD